MVTHSPIQQIQAFSTTQETLQNTSTSCHVDYTLVEGESLCRTKKIITLYNVKPSEENKVRF